MWLICFWTNIVTITPLKERGIRPSSKLFQFAFQTAFCSDLNSQSFISVKRPQVLFSSVNLLKILRSPFFFLSKSWQKKPKKTFLPHWYRRKWRQRHRSSGIRKCSATNYFIKTFLTSKSAHESPVCKYFIYSLA